METSNDRHKPSHVLREVPLLQFASSMESLTKYVLLALLINHYPSMESNPNSWHLALFAKARMYRKIPFHINIITFRTFGCSTLSARLHLVAHCCVAPLPHAKQFNNHTHSVFLHLLQDIGTKIEHIAWLSNHLL